MLKDGTHNPPDEVETGIPLLTAENIHDGLIDYEKKYWCISKDAYLEMHKKYEIQPNDLLLTIVGTLGRVSQVKDNKRFSVQRSVAILRTNKKILSDFLYHFINSKYFQDQLIARAKSTAQSGVYLGELSKIPIWFPTEHSEQQKIATILSNIDELIQKQQHVIEQTQKLMKGHLQKLLLQGIGHGDDLQEVKLNNLSQTKKVLIPTDWNVRRIEDFTKIDPETINENEFGSIEIEYVDIGSITDYKIKETQTIPLEERPSRAQKILRKNDVIISTVRPYLKSFSIIENEVENLVGSTGFAVIRTTNSFDSKWIFYFSQTYHFLTYLTRLMQGNNYPAVTSPTVANALIPYPNNPKEKEKIVSFLSNLDLLIQQEKQYKEKLEKIKRGLMQQLLTGKTRVKV